MTTNHHTPIPSSPKQPADAATFNAPLSELDTKISGMDSDLNDVVAESSSTASAMATVQTTVADHETRITTMEDDMPVPSGNASEYYNGAGGFSVPAGSGSTNGHVIQSGGVPQTQRVNLNFTGSGVSVIDGPTATEVQINAGSVPDGDYGDVTVSGTGAVMTVDSIGGKTISTDGTLGLNSDNLIPTEKAVKTYADALIASSDAMVFKGVIDCSANPDYPSGDRGHTYRVSVAGKIGGASGVVVEVGDIALCLTDSTTSGDQATVGASWAVVQSNIDGAVVGPASSTVGNIATFAGTAGKTLQDSGKSLPAGSIVGTSDAQTLTNKRIQKRLITVTQSATPTINTDNGEVFTITGLAQAITGFTFSGTPNDADQVEMRITDNGTSRAITPGASCIGTSANSLSGIATTASKILILLWQYNSTLSKWVLLGKDSVL